MKRSYTADSSIFAGHLFQYGALINFSDIIEHINHAAYSSYESLMVLSSGTVPVQGLIQGGWMGWLATHLALSWNYIGMLIWKVVNMYGHA